jgi:hypothetical protein
VAAGRACVPLDAGHPLERNQLIARHANAAAVIAAGAIAAQARKLFAHDLPFVEFVG